MNEREKNTSLGTVRAEVLASPLRIELVGLFGEDDILSVRDMALRTGRKATTLYHHVNKLLEAEVLREAGTRPRGKRYETLYELVHPMVGLEVEQDDSDSLADAMKVVRSALRMAERDVAAALPVQGIVTEGPARELVALRLHMRCSPEMLADVNGHIDAVIERIQREAAEAPEPGPDDRFFSLTLALAPLRGRAVEPSAVPNEEDAP